MNGEFTTKKDRSKGKPHIYLTKSKGFAYSLDCDFYYSYETEAFCWKLNSARAKR